MAQQNIHPVWFCRLLPAMICVAAMLATGGANAQGLIYQDANDGFVGAANLSDLNDINSLDFFINDDLWGFRPSGPDTATGFAADGSIFVAGDGRSDGITEPTNAEDVPVISQTLTGLTPNTNFDVYVVYWSANNADWNVRAGSSSVNGANQLFNRTGADINGASATAGVSAASAVWTQLPPDNSTPGVFEEDNRVMLLGGVGSMMSSGSGELSLFVDDLSDETNTNAFNQRTWFDGVAVIPAGQDAFAQANVNRGTGDVDIVFNNTAGLDIVSYSVTSTTGGLNSANWNSIAEGSNGSLDTDPWTEDVGTDLELSESEDAPATDGFNLNGTFMLGDVWRTSPYDDAQITLNLSDSSSITVQPTYSGPEVTFGSFDGDTDVDTADFAILMSNMFGSASPTAVESYFLGDVTGDLVVDFEDFTAFEALFDAANGPGAFVALGGAPIPEPSSIIVLTVLAGLFVLGSRKRLVGTFVSNSQPFDVSHLEFSPMISFRRLAASVVVVSLIALPKTADAVLVGSYDFEGGSLADGSGNGNDAFVSEGAFPGSGATFTTGATTDPIRGAVFDLSGGGVGGDGSNGGLNLNLPVAGNNTGAWTLDMWFRETDADGDAYLFDNRNTATGMPAGLNRFILSPGQNTGDNGPALWNGDAWQPVGSPAINDGAWHHVAWVYDSAVAGGTFNTYVDGAPGTAITGLSVADLLLEDIELGNEGTGGGGGGQEGRLIDDVGVFSRALTAEEIAERAVPLTLDLIVDTTDGTASIKNNQSFSFDFDFYQIDSGSDETPGTSLNPVGWNSLDDQEGADPPGTGWVEASNSSSRVIAEGNVTGSQVLNPGASVELGVLFDTSVGVEDLSFQFILEDGTAFQAGLVDYVPDDGIDPPTGGLDGDYNDDGVVNIADYTVWRDNLGASDESALNGNGDGGGVTASDYTFWKSNFGASSGAGAFVTSPVAVPEPSALGIVALCCVVGLVWRRS